MRTFAPRGMPDHVVFPVDDGSVVFDPAEYRIDKTREQAAAPSSSRHSISQRIRTSFSQHIKTYIDGEQWQRCWAAVIRRHAEAPWCIISFRKLSEARWAMVGNGDGDGWSGGGRW